MNEEAAKRPSGYSRRDVLKRGAVVGAVAVWTIPLVEAVSMTAAHAQSPSAPSGGNTPVNPPPSGGTAPETVVTTTTPPPSDGVEPAAVTAASAKADTGSLAFTGVDVPVPTAIGTATAAIALGVGALAAGAAYNKQRGGEAKPSHRG